jgi:glycosyltransferase involved in cell wall biosynthesis
MKIACYALAYNEELMLPHFIKHYKQFCDKIVIYDNMSTDNTKQIALDNGCDVITWESSDKGLNDQCYIDIKSNCYKKDRENFDWVLTIDTDEFYTHKNGIDSLLSTLEKYKKNGITLPKVQGYNMVGSSSLESIDSVFNINEGVPSVSYSKRCIFNPKINMNWSWGCHPEHGKKYLNHPSIIESECAELLLLHYKFINLDYVIQRHNYYKNRLSTFNKAYGLGIHYTYEEEKIAEEYKSLLQQKVKVI